MYALRKTTDPRAPEGKPFELIADAEMPEPTRVAFVAGLSEALDFLRAERREIASAIRKTADELDYLRERAAEITDAIREVSDVRANRFGPG